MASTTPANSAVNVSVSNSITVTFSEPVDSADLHFAVFVFDPAITGSFSVSGNGVTIDTESDLLYSTLYTVAIGTELSDTAGNRLAQPYQWSFTTVSDPNLLPPEIDSTWPRANAIGLPVNTAIEAYFSKPMDMTTLTTSTFAVAGVSGSVGYLDRKASFLPDAELAYNTTYQVAISTAVADTFGIHLASRFEWSFTTQKDPLVPVVGFILPQDSSIIDDTVTVFAEVDTAGLDSVQFFVDGSLEVTTTVANLFLLDLTSSALGSAHEVYARAFDSAGRMGVSDTLIIFQRWQMLAEDLDPIDGIPQKMQRVFYRSTDSTVEFRFEFAAAWKDPVNDTALDLVIYYDTDQSGQTGRTDFSGHTLNDVGAEKRVIIGIHGATAMAVHNPTTNPVQWDSLWGPEGFYSLDLPSDTTVFEFGLHWTDLGNAFFVDLVCINAFFQDQQSIVFDWIPNEGQGHITIHRANRYIGAGPAGSPLIKLRTDSMVTRPPNPFD